MGNALHTKGAGTAGVTDHPDARLDDGGLLAVGTGGLVSTRTGVMVGPGSTALVTGTSSTSPMRYSVAAHHWVTNRGVVSDGVYRGAAEAAKLVDTTAAPGSGSRIDIVWVKQNDAGSTISPDATSEPVYGCNQGNSSTGTPTAPTIPVGAEELARVTVTSAATRTDGTGVTITQTARQTVARGARVPVRSKDERDALTAYRGLEVYRIDTGQVQICTSTSPATWARLLDPIAPATNIVYSSAFQENAVSPLRPVRDANGIVTLAGLFTNSQVVNNVAGTWFTLPAGFRPTGLQAGTTYIEGIGLAAFTIDTNGVVAGIGMVVGAAPIPTPRYWGINIPFPAAGIPS